MQAHPALVLNADFRPLSYFPLSLLSWQDAITAVFKDHVSVVAEYDKWVSSPSTKMRLPSVVALRDYVPLPKRVAFTRFNVFLRDRFRCQYCGETFSAKDLTFEHVSPRSKGGETSWTNIVAACDPCNVKKDNRTSMKPIRAAGGLAALLPWLAFLLQSEQQGDHLNGLSQAHVISQAGAEAEVCQEMQPAQTAVLIRSQLGA